LSGTGEEQAMAGNHQNSADADIRILGISSRTRRRQPAPRKGMRRDINSSGALMDDGESAVCFASWRLLGLPGSAENADDPQTQLTSTEAQQKSELHSLLLMASLMLGDNELAAA
jgi:hypothetical protein